MHRTACGLALVVVLMTVAGCGGGGGGSALSGPTTSFQLSRDVVGTWSISGLALPGNQLGVQSNGDVVVNSEGTTRTRERSVAAVKIGTCSADGSINLNGSWVLNGAHYTITGAGCVNTGSHSMSLLATVRASDNGQEILAYEQVDADGTKVGETEYPPPPPSWEAGDGTSGDGDADLEYPPPPPI